MAKKSRASRLLYADAIRVPGVKAHLLAAETGRNYRGPKARPVPWEIVGPKLYEIWLEGGSAVPDAPESDALAALPSVAQLLEVVHVDAGLDEFTGLPRGYRERYREAMAEAERKLNVYAEDLIRSLQQRKLELLAEARLPKNKR